MRKSLVLAASFASLALLPQLRAQSPVPKVPSFEVSSVKRDTSESNPVRLGGPDISRFTAANVTAKTLIDFAYDLHGDFELSGGPSWIASEKFDVDGKVEDSLAQQLRSLPQDEQQAEIRRMLQVLLADRFQLAIHHETKEQPIFALVPAKGGSKLPSAASPDPQSAPFPDIPHPGAPTLAPGQLMISVFTGGNASIAGKSVTVSKLAKILEVQFGRHVDDRTGLQGSYDVTLRYTMDASLGGFKYLGPEDPSGGTSIFTAIQEQLGLKLESTKGPVDTIVIDHIEEPSPN